MSDDIDAATKSALRELAEIYASAVDRRDPMRLVSAFHPDATLAVYDVGADKPTSEMVGHESISKVTERIARYVATFHMLGQSTLWRNGDEIHAETYCTAHHLTSDDDPQDKVMYIRYHDNFRIGDDGHYRIWRREVRPEWTETTLANLRSKSE